MPSGASSKKRSSTVAVCSAWRVLVPTRNSSSAFARVSSPSAWRRDATSRCSVRLASRSSSAPGSARICGVNRYSTQAVTSDTAAVNAFMTPAYQFGSHSSPHFQRVCHAAGHDERAEEPGDQPNGMSVRRRTILSSAQGIAR